eukprot:CAMPEP_0185543450 /NCGR_PEP_ID=MMETSP1381-20130426/3273_1 /TAXON_ID=298111 /ORGANISM="Pavlova sp., Strain CCMP459" /LENGTH=112 /DNA_ID=CAMNT_0028155551 /DNA_START=525 /DNA_END=863 /DNA_ORIENTATION=-
MTGTCAGAQRRASCCFLEYARYFAVTLSAALSSSQGNLDASGFRVDSEDLPVVEGPVGVAWGLATSSGTPAQPGQPGIPPCRVLSPCKKKRSYRANIQQCRAHLFLTPTTPD